MAQNTYPLLNEFAKSRGKSFQFNELYILKIFDEIYFLLINYSLNPAINIPLNTTGDPRFHSTIATHPEVLFGLMANAVKSFDTDEVQNRFIKFYLLFQNLFFENERINDKLKLQIFLCDYQFLKYLRIYFTDFDFGYKYYNYRIALYRKAYVDKMYPSIYISTKFSFDETIFKNYFLLQEDAINFFIRHRSYDKLKNFILEELRQTKDRLTFESLKKLIEVNTHFVLMTKEEFNEVYSEFSHAFSQEQHQVIQHVLSLSPIILPYLFYHTTQNSISCNWKDEPKDERFNPQKLLVPKEELQIPLNLKFETIDYGSIDETWLDFVIPFDVPKSTLYSDAESMTFEFTPIKRFIDHVLFHYKDKFFVGGATISHLLDMDEDDDENYTHVHVVLKEKFHPEFRLQIKDGAAFATDSNFEYDEVYGVIHLPTKIRIIKGLLDLYKTEKLKGIQKHQLNIHLFSSYYHQLVVNGKSVVKCAQFFTSEKIFDKFSRRYFEKLSGLDIYSKNIVEAFDNFNIVNYSTFRDFVTFLFENFLINVVRSKGGYRYFWVDRECEMQPKDEEDIQPYLLGQILHLCMLKGVKVIRENISADGRIDLLFHYTTRDGKSLTLVVEVKKAQHADVVTSISRQLVTYLDAEQTKWGIYVVLWFKGPNSKYLQPTKYNTIDELRLELIKNSPNTHQVSTLIIDCTKPYKPSDNK